jgi:hypothetical protein
MQLVADSAALWRGGLLVPWQSATTAPPPPVNEAPIVGSDSATAISGQSISVDVLANDMDPEGDRLSVIEARAETGAVEVDEIGILTYTAPAGFVGTDRITYVVSDAKGATAPGTLTITVTAPTNQAPSTGPDSASVASGESVAIDVLANDTDPEGGALSVTAASAETGSVTVGAGGVLTYTAPAGFSGTDTVSYTVSDPQGATTQGTVSVTVTSVTLSVEQNETDGSIIINAGTGEIEITISQPSAYEGSYTVDPADLAGGPWKLVDPTLSGAATAGSTLTAVPGLWIHDTANAPLQVARQWVRGGTPIAGETGLGHVVTSEDLSEGLVLSETALDAAGQRKADVTVIEGGQAGGFVERGVAFDGASYLVRGADLGPDSEGVIFFASLIPAQAGRFGLLQQGHAQDLYLWDGSARVKVVSPTGATYIVNSRTLPVGERVHIIGGLVLQDDGAKRLEVWSRFPGDADWVLDNSSGRNLSVDLSFGSFVVGARNPPIHNYFLGTIFRIACWGGDALPDIGQASVRAAFLTADGKALADPAVSRAMFGTPLVDVYGPASDYRAGLNHGAAGNFDTIVGQFSDA